MYAHSFTQGKVCMGWKIKVKQYQGFLLWYWPIVMSATKNIDPIKEYHWHKYGFDLRYLERKKLYKEVKIKV